MVTKATFLQAGGEERANVTTWGPLVNGEAGDAISGDRTARAFMGSVQANGVFGAGGNVVIEGSNDGVNWFPAAAAITVGGIQQIAIYTHYIRPRVTAGDGTTAVLVSLFLKNYPST